MGRPSKAVLKHREEALRYYYKNREKVLLRMSNYSEEQKEKIRKRNKDRREAHPIRYARLKRESYLRNIAAAKARSLAYNNKHREEKAAASREWRRLHPRKAKALCMKSKHDYRARLALVSGSFSFKEFRDLCKKYNYCCVCCGRSEQHLLSINLKLVPDHVKPISLGGPNTIENIQPLCHPMLGGRGGCNSSKHAKEIDYRNTDIALSLMIEKEEAA
jgi:hypothetical protein